MEMAVGMATMMGATPAWRVPSGLAPAPIKAVRHVMGEYLNRVSLTWVRRWLAIDDQSPHNHRIRFPFLICGQMRASVNAPLESPPKKWGWSLEQDDHLSSLVKFVVPVFEILPRARDLLSCSPQPLTDR